MTRIPNPAYMSYGNTAGVARASRSNQGFSGGLFFGPVIFLGDGDTIPSSAGLVVANTAGGIVNLTIPTASFGDGQGVYVKRNGANNVVITPSSGNIDASGSYTLTIDLQSVLLIRQTHSLSFSAVFYVAAGYLEP